MRTAKSRGGTPIFIAPGQAAQREADWGQTTALSQQTAPCSNAEPLTAWKSRIACASIACGCGGIQDSLACRLLPVSTTVRPILLHRLDKLCPQPGKPCHRRAARGTARASRLSHPAAPSQRAAAPTQSIPNPQSQPPPSWSPRFCGRPSAAPPPPPRSTAHPPPAFPPAHASYGSAHPPPSCS